MALNDEGVEPDAKIEDKEPVAINTRWVCGDDWDRRSLRVDKLTSPTPALKLDMYSSIRGQRGRCALLVVVANIMKSNRRPHKTTNKSYVYGRNACALLGHRLRQIECYVFLRISWYEKTRLILFCVLQASCGVRMMVKSFLTTRAILPSPKHLLHIFFEILIISLSVNLRFFEYWHI